MNEATSLAEARRQLETACAHLSECSVLYGDKRLDRGIPTDRSWALLPLCRALRTMLEAMGELDARLTALEERLASPYASPTH
ncbi:MAG: hypothetical protein HUU35_09730 [Armatimonadetes bacterium]|nr:hypothetical protein [Armatimonadota bacterium]